VGFRLDDLPTPPPVFDLIQQHGGVATAEMYRVFNMGIGFCVIVPPDGSAVGAVESTFRAHGFATQPIGTVVADERKRVVLAGPGLVGEGDEFREG
jgi:phosphoribosylformylglycinamidine cyclo-ligase